MSINSKTVMAVLLTFGASFVHAHEFWKCPTPSRGVTPSLRAKELEFTSLMHYTYPRYLPSILEKGGLLKPSLLKDEQGRSIPHTGRDAVYLSLVPSKWKGTSLLGTYSDEMDTDKSGITNYSLDRIVLIFDLSLMDKNKNFTAMADWGYGSFFYGGLKAWGPQNIECFFEDMVRLNYTRNEIVFNENVDIKFLKKIWIHPDKRAEFLLELSQLGILSINGKPLKYFIESRKEF